MCDKSSLWCFQLRPVQWFLCIEGFAWLTCILLPDFRCQCLKSLAEASFSMNYLQDTIRIQFWWFPVLFWNQQSQKGALWSPQVDCTNSEVRVSPVWQTREGRGRFMGAQVPCWLQSGFNTSQSCSREVPWYLVLNSSSISLGTRECRSMEAISSAQLPSQAVTRVLKNTTTKAEYNAAVCTQTLI